LKISLGSTPAIGILFWFEERDWKGVCVLFHLFDIEGASGCCEEQILEKFLQNGSGFRVQDRRANTREVPAKWSRV